MIDFYYWTTPYRLDGVLNNADREFVACDYSIADMSAAAP